MNEVIAVLILFMVAGAIVAVETSRLLFSVISVGAVGFLLAIAFLFLGAPDVAIVQIGVEVISLVILVRATIGREPETPLRRPLLVGSIAAVTLVAAIGLLGLQTFAEFPAFGSSVMERVADAPSRAYLQDGLARTGAPNAVTAVLLDFRAYDTLGEATVLFCAVLGALTVLRRQARTAVEGAADEKERDPQ
jgi:multisubunit Na+/H+ antiporter MnhB subunit